MRYDFTSVKDEQDFTSVPEGTYRCRVGEVRTGVSKDGSERWALRLEVADGQWSGRTAAWDWITWSERGVLRVKKVLEAFGFDVRGELEVEPEQLEGLEVQVVVEAEEWEDKLNGSRQLRMRVPYMGYGPPEGDPNGVAVDDRGGEGESCLHGTDPRGPSAKFPF